MNQRRQPLFPDPSNGVQEGRPPSNRGSSYNIIPDRDHIVSDHPSLRFPELRAAISVLRSVDNLRKPPSWRSDYDILDWLRLVFGFQKDNVRNQREHLLLHLANLQLRNSTPLDHDSVLSLDHASVRRFRKNLLKNYTRWCSFLHRKSSIWLSDRHESVPDIQREILYIALYLLIWGESANLRFVPEGLCYIFHHMSMDMNKILEGYIDEKTGELIPLESGENAYLEMVVRPFYETIRDEVAWSRNGTAPYSHWRNYDDINEYFWSDRCFRELDWPMKVSSSFFATDGKEGQGKTGFVEQRSFWNLVRSFNRLWLMLILYLQAAIIVAWDGKEYPWQSLGSRDIQVKMLTIFLTWSGMRFLQAILDLYMQYRLITKCSMTLGLRMLMKAIVAAAWIYFFWLLYGKIWSQRHTDRRWSTAANKRVVYFLELAFVFILPELFAVVMSFIPWIENFLVKTNWRIFSLLTWWFQGRIFVGRGLREGLMDTGKYTLFWLLVLASKFSFSYFLQIKPMVKPTKQLIHLHHVAYDWHQFFGDSNRFAVGLLWLPVVLMYLMDLQIWYSIYSSIVGAFVGLFDHLGEIRNLDHLRLRFQFFASAVQFNLIPEEQILRSSVSRFHDFIHRLKLRYGLGKPYKTFEPNQVEVLRFSCLWNEIIAIFREEDIISDEEVELLELPCSSTWYVRVISWPCFLLCNELLLALGQAKELVDAPDKWLWYKISKHEYGRCAVVEAYDSIRNLLNDIIKTDSQEQFIIRNLFQEIDHAIQSEKFTKSFRLTALPKVHGKLSELLELLIEPRKDLRQIVHTLQALYEIAIRDFCVEWRISQESAVHGLAPRSPGNTDELLFVNAVELPGPPLDEKFYRQVRRLHTILTSRDSMHNVPSNLEARRRIAFFSNSLFMSMPHAPQIEKMMAFSVLTPYYNEEVLYGREQLLSKNEDGVSILYYLRTIYPDEWANFKQRMRREGLMDKDEIYTTKLRDLRLWASCRGQTLARTVRGMMYYYRALKMLAFLDTASEVQIMRKLRGIDTATLDDGLDDISDFGRSPSSVCSGRTTGLGDLSFGDHESGIAMIKYTYVVTCQIYGTLKAKKDPRADEILSLMKNHEALRVAYVDEVSRGGEKEYYSVLVKYDQQLQKEVEVYRVKLPGPMKLGEGKPENQNHAIVFTRGDAVQTIDMNQDNYFEEALKMRNLLEEYNSHYGIRKPTLLGIREHVFTGSVSSLAWFMSAQEKSFVTLGKRVLANPLKVRMHYGHPDVFDRFWFLTRGGISKASRVINISEDIFAGFNCTLRGGNVTHHEYIQVGKGRDVGLNQISMFEAKVAGGNSEQALSRDVYRLGHRLDFFRMLSFFYTTVGFFFNTMMVILTVYAFLWGRLYLSLSGIEGAASSSGNNKALGTIMNQQFIIQIGLFTALPMIVENSLEEGFVQAIWDFLMMQFQMSSVFYTFSMGTRAHYFGRTILHGGARYRPTGRGFVVQHKSFSENYRLYSRSHFVKAVELGFILTIYGAYSPVATYTLTYIAMTISSWFLVVSWAMAPFLFNPSGFDWLKAVYDFDEFMDWIWFKGGVFVKAKQSWEKWWYEEQEHLRTTGLFGKLLEIILDLRFFFFQYSIVYKLRIANGSTSIVVYLLSWICLLVVYSIYTMVSSAHDKYAARRHIYYRLVQFLTLIMGIISLISLLNFTSFKVVDIFTSMLAFIPTGWGFILIAQVFRPVLQRTRLWNSVVSVARLYDIMLGVIIMAPVAILSWIPGFQSMQTRMLFNQAFSRGLRISQLVAVKKS